MVERSGKVVIRMLDNIRKLTIETIIKKTMAKGSLVFFRDEYVIICNGVKAMGYDHKFVCRSQGECARNEDTDGFH